LIQLNDKFKPLFKNDTRFFIVTGGRGATKSFSVNTFIALLSLEKSHKVLFTRQTLSSAHVSIIPEFKEKIELLNLQSVFDINRTTIQNKASGSEIIFKGLKTSSGDQTASLKSLQGITTWILDEAEEMIDEKLFDKINLSLRTKGTQNRVILILNPATKEHWIYKRFFEDAGVQAGWNGQKNNVTYIHTTYLDNIKHLDQSFLDEVERMKTKNPSKYEHIINGSWLEKAEGVVFTNWEYGEFNPKGIQTIFGQDYGFSIDPTTLIEVAIDKRDKIIWVKEHLYKAKLTTSQIAEINKSCAGNSLIIGDSAEPRLIQELNNQGNNVMGAMKGQGSISLGISLLLDYKLIVEVNSTNIAKELNNFTYADKKSKLFVDDFNHTIDPLRYVASYVLGNQFGIEIR
jgi:phage terminase large subunit